VFFRKRFSCRSCLCTTERVGIRDALPFHVVCEQCGEKTDEEIVGMAPELEASALAPSTLGHSMVSIGFRPGDVFTVTSPNGAGRFEFGEDRAWL
jgi:hypothetical protein